MIEVNNTDSGINLKLQGNLMINDARQLKQAFMGAIVTGEDLILDMQQVQAIDFACIQLMLAMFKSCGSDQRVIFSHEVPQVVRDAFVDIAAEEFLGQIGGLNG